MSNSFATPWTAAHQASLSFAVSQSRLKLMSIESVMLSNDVIICPPLHPPFSSSCPQSFPALGSFPVFYMAIIWFYLYFCPLLMPLHIYSPPLSLKMLKLMKIGCCDPSFPFLCIGNLIYTHGFRNQHDCPWFISRDLLWPLHWTAYLDTSKTFQIQHILNQSFVQNIFIIKS